MGHGANAKEGIYRALAERLNKCPVGVPFSEDLVEILYRLYTESEALTGSKFPLVPMTLDGVAAVTGINKEELQKTLEDMADKGLVVDLPRRDGVYYLLAPMIIGFFEFTFMRVRDDLDMKEMAHLFEKYFMNFDFGRELFGYETKLMQALIYEKVIPAAVETEVLDYERASAVIRRSGGGSIGLCACRHKADHLGTPCALNAPLDVCTTLGEFAAYTVHRGFARPASVDELLRVLELTEEHGLVHLADNVLNEPAYICHCCGCCCGMLHAAREYGISTVHPASFTASVDAEKCNGCGDCAEKCQVRAISMNDCGDGNEVAGVDRQRCLGCGICASSCSTEAITMSRRGELYEPPVDKTALLLRMARERGKEIKLGLQDFLVL